MQNKNENIPYLKSRKVLYYVLFFHLLFFYLFFLNSPKVKKIHVSNKKIAVRTVSIKKEPPKPIIAEKKVLPTSTSSQKIGVKNSSQEQKKVVSNKVVKQQVEIRSKPNVSSKLVEDLKKSMQALNSSSPISMAASDEKVEKTVSLGIPKRIQRHTTADIQMETAEKEGSKISHLTEELQFHLHLPEHGQVRCSFSINKEGGVENLQVLSSQNKKNEEYIKKTLPRLHFPWFNQPRIENVGKLVIVFKNEEG